VKASARAFRVAIVGLGPKGLYALERLIHHSRRLPSRPIELTIYEPHPAPGAGPVYDPSQPSYLRMNFAAELIDMWHDGDGPSFTEWRERTGGVGEDAYPPRSHVGQYLVEGFEGLWADPPDAVRIDLRAERVVSLVRGPDDWMVSSGGTEHYDEVLLATGHENMLDARLSGHSASELPRTAVYPVERELSLQRVPAGATVAVRGFALTMIDAALALTEGRGGRFTQGREPHLLRYERCGKEPAVISPWSRTGRPMLAKPDPSFASFAPGISTATGHGRQKLLALSGGTTVSDAVRVIAEVAMDILRAVVPRAHHPAEDLEAVLTSVSMGGAISADCPPEVEIERSVAVASGAAMPGRDWALGHTWRALYPALVQACGDGGLPAEDWPAFHLLAREMERLAFGPPTVNAAKLLALIEAGMVDLSSLRSGPVSTAEVVVDGVLSPPGVFGARQPLWDGLVSDGHVRLSPGHRGIEITRDVECVGVNGSPTRGLGVIGRPTEDWVIGNDTLNRALHPQPERWARRVASRAAR
jgi:diaminopimelate decarboxylase